MVIEEIPNRVILFPMECSPSPMDSCAYEIIPIPDGLLIEKDVMVTMPDGVKSGLQRRSSRQTRKISGHTFHDTLREGPDSPLFQT